MKSRQVRLEEILAKELKNDEFRLAYDERRFYLQIARLISDLRARAGFPRPRWPGKPGSASP